MFLAWSNVSRYFRLDAIVGPQRCEQCNINGAQLHHTRYEGAQRPFMSWATMLLSAMDFARGRDMANVFVRTPHLDGHDDNMLVAGHDQPEGIGRTLSSSGESMDEGEEVTLEEPVLILIPD